MHFPQARSARRFPKVAAAGERPLPASRRLRRLLSAGAGPSARAPLPATLIALAMSVAVAGCQRGPVADAASTASAAAAAAGVVALRVPADSEMPAGALGASVRRGRALLENTRDSLPAFVGNKLRCLSCHLDEGMRANASPLIGVYARYPAYNARSASTLTIQDRINGCFVRSMNGRPLPAPSADLRDITAYLAFLSRGVPVGASVKGQGLPRMTPLPGDTARGRTLFASTCSRCHGANGGGTVVAPPLWGHESFNIGAGMARLRTAASFIRHNMPFDKPGTLTDQQAFDVAAYITSRPRPDLPAKEYDWPKGGAPPDVAYPTLGAHPPRVDSTRAR